jgi:hypothetical protein
VDPAIFLYLTAAEKSTGERKAAKTRRDIAANETRHDRQGIFTTDGTESTDKTEMKFHLSCVLQMKTCVTDEVLSVLSVFSGFIRG